MVNGTWLTGFTPFVAVIVRERSKDGVSVRSSVGLATEQNERVGEGRREEEEALGEGRGEREEGRMEGRVDLSTKAKGL